MENKRFGTINIKQIPDDLTIIENSPAFKTVFKLFNKYVKKNPEIFVKYKNMFGNEDYKFTVSQVQSNNMLIKYFEDFVYELGLTGKLRIQESEMSKFKLLKADFEERCHYILSGSSSVEYYDEIIIRVFGPDGGNKNDITVRQQMLAFNSAYHLMKHGFAGKVRKGKLTNEEAIRYFDHLTGTMEILLKELPNPNLKKLIMGLLHDSREDLGLTLEDIKIIFGEEIAEGIKHLSKLDSKLFMSESELEFVNAGEEGKFCHWPEYKEIITRAKDNRNKQYFGDLDYHDDDVLDVKFADRIHNLRTLTHMPQDHIIRKIKETEKYFLDVAKRRNPTAYKLIMKEINNIKTQFNLD